MNLLNSCFEAIAALLGWISVYKLYRQRQVTGVFAPSFVFSALWSCTAIFYYASHNDMFSSFFCCLRAGALIVWSCLWAHFSLSGPQPQKLRLISSRPRSRSN